MSVIKGNLRINLEKHTIEHYNRCYGNNDYYNHKFETLCRAVLCGIFSQFADVTLVLKDLDYYEVGFTRREILDWWEEYKEIDRQRRVGLKRKKEREELKKIALSKLTEEERKVLNL